MINLYLCSLVRFITNGFCQIDPYNRRNTISNLKYSCNYRQLQNVFSNLSPGTFPTGRLKGFTIVGPDALVEAVWSGKNFYYGHGADHGTVTNTFLGIFQFLRASIYRTIAPIDGKEAFAVDYRNEIFAFLMIDYLRKVQNNLYLGFVAIRGFEKVPVAYFLLEGV